MTAPLTARQNQILAFIVMYWGQHMAPPAIREICGALGISSPNGVVCHLKALAAKGAIVWSPAKGSNKGAHARNIVVPELLAAAKAAASEFFKGRTAAKGK